MGKSSIKWGEVTSIMQTNQITQDTPTFPLPKSNIQNNPQRWLLLNHGLADSERILAKEENLAYRVGQGETPPVLELWTAPRKCFVLGKIYARRLERLGKIDSIKKHNIPIILRSSGGEGILHDSTCLNFSVIVPRGFYPGLTRVDEAFKILSSGVVECLRKMKIPVHFGRVKVFCPGPYDLLVEGKKVAGLALLSRQKFCLLQGTLFVNTGVEYIKELETFYGPLGGEITSLRHLTGRLIRMESLVASIVHGYKTSLNITFCSCATLF